MGALNALAPLWVVFGGSLATLLLGTVKGFKSPAENRILAAMTLLAAIVAVLGSGAVGSDLLLGGTVVNDALARIMDVLYLGIGALVVLASDAQLQREGVEEYEYFPLVLVAVAGVMVMTHGVELITILLGLEIHSLAVYVLTGSSRKRVASGEGALKYFLLGAFASAFLVYGAALTYVATGSFYLSGIEAHVAAHGFSPLLAAAGTFLVVGLGFKVALVPFHWWTPDAYQGAPAPIAAFMSTATKAAGFALLIRLFDSVLGADIAAGHLFVLLGGFTIIVGNLFALPQMGIKRMLAYSSVAHAGYIAVAFVGGSAAVGPVLFYLVAYALTGIAGFLLVGVLQREGAVDLDRRELRGLARRHPLLAFALLVVMLSLAGVPPTAGFAAKFGIFRVLVSSDAVGLAILVVATSAMAAYYYLQVIVEMYMAESVEADDVALHVGGRLAVLLAVAAIIILGVAPGLLMAPAATESATTTAWVLQSPGC